MRSIRKQWVLRDSAGNVLSMHTESLSDDGQGNLHVREERTALWCPGCNRPIVDVDEIRGRCDHCQASMVCVECEAKCQACSKTLCGFCRKGFAGRTAMTVCPECLQRLDERLALEDRLLAEKTDVERKVTLQRGLTALMDLRLRAAKMKKLQQLSVIRELGMLTGSLRRSVRDERRRLR